MDIDDYKCLIGRWHFVELNVPIFIYIIFFVIDSKTCPFKKNTKTGFQYRLSLNAGQKYCRIHNNNEPRVVCMALHGKALQLRPIILPLHLFAKKNDFFSELHILVT